MIGEGLSATGTGSAAVVIGKSSNAGPDAIAIGRIASAPITATVSIGNNLNGTTGTCLLGNGVIAGLRVTVVGFHTAIRSYGADSTCIGYDSNDGGSAQNTLVGSGTTSTSQANTVSGYQAFVSTTATGQSAVYGALARSTATAGTALGYNSLTSADNGVAVGAGAQCGHTGSVALGQGAVTGNANSIYLRTGLATAATGASVSVVYDTTTGRLYPVTSSRRFKKNIDNIRDPERVLNIMPKMYNLKPDVCGCDNNEAYEYDIREERDGVYYYEIKTEEVEITDSRGGKIKVKQPVKKSHTHVCVREFGAIAEEVYEICPEIVALDPAGDPLSIMYDRIALYLIPIVRANKTTIESQATTISTLQSTVTSQATTISTLQSTVSANAASISTLQSTVTSQAATIATMQSAITALQTSVSRLNSGGH